MFNQNVKSFECLWFFSVGTQLNKRDDKCMSEVADGRHVKII